MERLKWLSCIWAFEEAPLDKQFFTCFGIVVSVDVVYQQDNHTVKMFASSNSFNEVTLNDEIRLNHYQTLTKHKTQTMWLIIKNYFTMNVACAEFFLRLL